MGLGWKCSFFTINLKTLIFPMMSSMQFYLQLIQKIMNRMVVAKQFLFSQKSFSPFAFRNALIWSCQVTASLGFIIAFFTQWRCQPCLFHLHSAQSMSSCLLCFVKKYLVFVPNFLFVFFAPVLLFLFRYLSLSSLGWKIAQLRSSDRRAQ